jgi:hypothetical protein
MGKRLTGFYPYQRVERALCAVFEIPSNQRSRLRARIKHMQKLGLKAAERPADARAEYEREGVDQWLVALAMMDYHIDPVLAVKTVQANWRRGKDGKPRGTELVEIVRMARESTDENEHGIFLTLTVGSLPARPEPLIALGYLRPIDVNKRTGKMQENWKAFFAPRPRGLVPVPLSYLLHRLDEALRTPREKLP